MARILCKKLVKNHINLYCNSIFTFGFGQDFDVLSWVEGDRCPISRQGANLKKMGGLGEGDSGQLEGDGCPRRQGPNLKETGDLVEGDRGQFEEEGGQGEEDRGPI